MKKVTKNDSINEIINLNSTNIFSNFNLNTKDLDLSKEFTNKKAVITTIFEKNFLNEKDTKFNKLYRRKNLFQTNSNKSSTINRLKNSENSFFSKTDLKVFSPNQMISKKKTKNSFFDSSYIKGNYRKDFSFVKSFDDSNSRTQKIDNRESKLKDSNKKEGSFAKTSKDFFQNLRDNKKIMKKKFEVLDEYNLNTTKAIIESDIENQRKYKKVLNEDCDNLKSKYILTRSEFDILKEDLPKRNGLVGVVQFKKGKYCYIDENKAHMIRVSDVVSKLNVNNCLNFNGLIKEKYNENIKKIEKLNDNLSKFTHIHKLKKDNLFENKCQIKFIEKKISGIKKRVFQTGDFVEEKRTSAPKKVFVIPYKLSVA